MDRLEPTTFPAGTVLFNQGDAAEAAYLVQEGVIEIVLDDQIVAEIERGTLFGEMALINDLPRAAAARVKEDAVCIVVPKSVFNSTLRGMDAFTRSLIQSLIQHVRNSHKQPKPPVQQPPDPSDPEVQFFMPQKDGSYRPND